MSTDRPDPEPVPAAPPAPTAEAVAEFGEHLDVAVRYVAQLAGAGVERGLLGPRETPRLWERHLVNCVRLERLVPAGASVLDVGSGAGLPGIVLGLVRPDLSVVLLEPLLRRSQFLQETVDLLGLAHVTVARGRAEDQATGSYDVVTSRAVAPLEKLARWCLPLVQPEGRMLALKGSTAAEELSGAQGGVQQSGGSGGIVHTLRGADGSPPTVVVEIRRAELTRTEHRRLRKRRA